MRWEIPFSITVLLCVACLFCGCTSSQQAPPANQSQNVTIKPTYNVGMELITTEPAPVYVSFEDAIAQLPLSEPLSLDAFPNNVTHIFFIQGGNLDSTGDAEQWVFGITKGGRNELRVYDISGWTIIPWNNPLAGEEISLDRLVNPRTIFGRVANQTGEAFSSLSTVRRDIDIRNGTDTVSITSGGTEKILRFNASSGAAID